MILSQKQKKFSDFLAGVLKSSSNFEHFRKKDDLNSQIIFEINDSQTRG